MCGNLGLSDGNEKYIETLFPTLEAGDGVTCVWWKIG